MTDQNVDATADEPGEVTDLNGNLETDADPTTVADVRDEQQIVDLDGGDAAGGDSD